MRIPMGCLGVLGLAACSATPQHSGPVAGRDVACLNQQGRVDLVKAMAVCDTKLPDLTGDRYLQAVALSDHIPFTIRPKADAALKDRPSVIVGTLIPEPPSLYPNEQLPMLGSGIDFTGTP